MQSAAWKVQLLLSLHAVVVATGVAVVAIDSVLLNALADVGHRCAAFMQAESASPATRRRSRCGRSRHPGYTGLAGAGTLHGPGVRVGVLVGVAVWVIVQVGVLVGVEVLVGVGVLVDREVRVCGVLVGVRVEVLVIVPVARNRSATVCRMRRSYRGDFAVSQRFSAQARIGANVAIQVVGADAAVDVVGAAAAEDRIVVVLAAQRIATRSAVDIVIAAAAEARSRYWCRR